MSSCHSSTFWSGSSPRSNLVKGWQASASLARIPWHKSAMIGGLVWWMWQNLKHTASHCIILSVTFCRFVHDSRAALEFETLCRSPKIKLLGDAFLSFSLSPHLERSYIGRKSSLYYITPCHSNLLLWFSPITARDHYVNPSKTFETRCSPRTRMLTRMQSRTIPFCNSLFEQSCACFPCYCTSLQCGV